MFLAPKTKQENRERYINKKIAVGVSLRFFELRISSLPHRKAAESFSL
jgi:hypothetical protein